MSFALKFISGKYKDGQFPLEEGRVIHVGRSSEVEMVLVEEMVSRRHARIELRGDVIYVDDLESTNGTFVNGERISKAQIGESDRILIGSNILKVVRVLEPGEEAPTSVFDEPPPTIVSRLSHRRQVGASGESRMSGNLAEIPLPDLLQLFGSSRKSGVLLVEANSLLARIFLDAGLVQHVEIDGPDNSLLPLAPRKAMYRLLAWDRGLFELEPHDEGRSFNSPMQATVQELLMDGFREKDELKQLGANALPRGKRLIVNSSVGRLSELTPVELDTWQLALRTQTVDGTIDESPHTDLATMNALIKLRDGGFLSVSQ